jgi:fumarylacetoacetase
MPLEQSWVTSANSANCAFPLNNLPLGSMKTENGAACAVAIGDFAVNLTAAEAAGLISFSKPLCKDGNWDRLIAEPSQIWASFRRTLKSALALGSSAEAGLNPYLVKLADITLNMPFTVTEYTDFYAGRYHATNVGTMFRGAENALPPNWLHIPIGYNGRASSVVVSGTDVRRPWGQLKGPNDDLPKFAPCARFDFELEMGAIVGRPSTGPVSVAKADAMIFGYVLLNDWSARDIQAWEYQPLGPFQAKATATSISPWIVMKEALEPCRTETPPREFELLPHLRDCGPMLYDIDLEVSLTPQGQKASTLARTNYREMYYSSAQQLAHHTTSGCSMRSGDLLGSGTISGPEKHQRGSLLELSWGGKEPMELAEGQSRSFLQDGDKLTLSGHAQGEGYLIGFGECSGVVLPALSDPFGGEKE